MIMMMMMTESMIWLWFYCVFPHINIEIFFRVKLFSNLNNNGVFVTVYNKDFFFHLNCDDNDLHCISLCVCVCVVNKNFFSLLHSDCMYCEWRFIFHFFHVFFLLCWSVGWSVIYVWANIILIQRIVVVVVLFGFYFVDHFFSSSFYNKRLSAWSVWLWDYGWKNKVCGERERNCCWRPHIFQNEKRKIVQTNKNELKKKNNWLGIFLENWFFPPPKKRKDQNDRPRERERESERMQWNKMKWNEMEKITL